MFDKLDDVSLDQAIASFVANREFVLDFSQKNGITLLWLA